MIITERNLNFNYNENPGVSHYNPIYESIQNRHEKNIYFRKIINDNKKQMINRMLGSSDSSIGLKFFNLTKFINEKYDIKKNK